MEHACGLSPLASAAAATLWPAAARISSRPSASATALNNLAATLREVGQRQEALGPAREAADLCRELAAQTPDAYREVGQPQQAFGPAQEAGDLHRELAGKALDAYRPDLAGSLATLANLWEEVGDLAHPAGFVHWVVPMCRQYTERCRKLGREPDAELLGPSRASRAPGGDGGP